MRLYIIRHAQSENNAQWANTGSSSRRRPDPLLSETGQQQAQHLADLLARADPDAQTDPWDMADQRGFAITHLYTSLMQRTILTATAVASALDLPLLAWLDLHEVGGVFENGPEEGQRIGLPGPNRAFFESHYPHLVLPDSLGEKGWWNRPYESRAEVRIRASRVAVELFNRHGGSDERVAIISHGAFSNYLLSHLLDRLVPPDDEPNPKFPWLMMSNTGITCLNYADSYATLYYTNRLDHLPKGLITI
ncbi:MAG TPA: histidine phosphatase family protein [Anaerolineae bacterium]|jgi:2,3-bisphosphoglycerate-dependent phosphoglycerate mutase|nr:histidine phosphatase family protein [Anaerolineae bacterium]